MTIIVDTREKPRAIVKILKEFDRQGVEVVRRKLNFADYFSPDNPRVVIDRKQNLAEVVKNLTYEKPRFLREVERCHRAGCRMIVLIEHSNRVKTLEDVIQWVNPRLKVSPLAVSGDRLYRIMKAVGIRYDIEWQFCDKLHTGQRIINILKDVMPHDGQGTRDIP